MKRTAVAILTVAFLVGGCIVTGNILIEIEFGDFVAPANESFAAVAVDLNDYSDYRDHREEINSADDMGFVCRVHNTGSNVATGQLWVSGSGTTAAIPDEKVLALEGLVVQPGQTREILLDESYDFLRNFTEVRKIVLGEVFTAYFTSKTTPFTLEVRDLVMILSVNGKP